jgi:glutaredoxin
VKTFLAALAFCFVALPAAAQDSTPAPESKELTMYATTWCGYCKRARAYFAAKQIAYREVDIEASPANKAEYKEAGGKGVPHFVQGERKMRGFTEVRMEKFLNPP